MIFGPLIATAGCACGDDDGPQPILAISGLPIAMAGSGEKLFIGIIAADSAESGVFAITSNGGPELEPIATDLHPFDVGASGSSVFWTTSPPIASGTPSNLYCFNKAIPQLHLVSAPQPGAEMRGLVVSGLGLAWLEQSQSSTTFLLEAPALCQDAVAPSAVSELDKGYYALGLTNDGYLLLGYDSSVDRLSTDGSLVPVMAQGANAIGTLLGEPAIAGMVGVHVVDAAGVAELRIPLPNVVFVGGSIVISEDEASVIVWDYSGTVARRVGVARGQFRSAAEVEDALVVATYRDGINTLWRMSK